MHDQPPQAGESASPTDLELQSNAALQSVPSGAFALAGTAVGLLIAAWLLIYVFVFLARGQVG